MLTDCFLYSVKPFLFELPSCSVSVLGKIFPATGRALSRLQIWNCHGYHAQESILILITYNMLVGMLLLEKVDKLLVLESSADSISCICSYRR